MNKFTEFYTKLTNDPAIAGEFERAIKEQKIPEGTPLSKLTDENIAALLSAAKKAGFEFTLDEVKTYFAKATNEELSDDELEAVAGGKGRFPCFPTGGKQEVLCVLLGL